MKWAQSATIKSVHQ